MSGMVIELDILDIVVSVTSCSHVWVVGFSTHDRTLCKLDMWSMLFVPYCWVIGIYYILIRVVCTRQVVSNMCSKLVLFPSYAGGGI